MSQPFKYSAISTAKSRFGVSQRVVKSLGMSGGGMERVTVVGVIIDVVNDKYDYSFSVVPIDLSKYTSPACVSDNGIMLNMGLSKVAPPEEIKQAIEKKRKASDMGKSIPKDRLVPEEYAERKFLMTTNDMRIQLEKSAVESTIDSSNASTDDKKDTVRTRTKYSRFRISRRGTKSNETIRNETDKDSRNHAYPASNRTTPIDNSPHSHSKSNNQV